MNWLTYLLLLLVVLFGGRMPEHKERFVGVSAYASFHPDFPVERFLQQYPKNIKRPAIALLWGTFGRNYDIVTKFEARFFDRPHIVEIHMANGCGRRRGALGPGEWAPGMSAAELNKALLKKGNRPAATFRRRVMKAHMAIQPLLGEWALTVVSPELESDLNTDALMVLIRIIREEWPEARIIASRNSEACASAGRCWVERHGASFHSADIKNLDGVSVDFNDGEKYFNQISEADAREWAAAARGSYAVFFWSATQQGVANVRDWSEYSNLTPRDRTFRVTDEAIAGMRRLLRAAE